MWDYITPAFPWIGYLLLLVTIVAGLFINILGLPGLWLIVLAVVGYAWATDFIYIGWWTIGIVIALGLLAELIEFFAGAAGSAKAGGSKRGMAGAIIGGIVGGIVGTPLFPIVGTIIGSIVGCALGAYLIETSIGKTHTESVSISLGAAKGKAIGLAAKSACGVAMGLVTAVMGLPINFGANNTTLPAPTTAPATQPTTAPTTIPASRPGTRSSRLRLSPLRCRDRHDRRVGQGHQQERGVLIDGSEPHGCRWPRVRFRLHVVIQQRW